MNKSDKDKILAYITEQTNKDVFESRLRIQRENGNIEGMQMMAEQIADFIRNLDDE